MEFSIKSGSPEKQRTGCVVVGVFEGRKLTASARDIDRAVKGFLSDVLRRGDHEGKAGTTTLLHSVTGIPADRVLLVGLGKEREMGESAYRKAIAAAVKALQTTGASDATFYLTELTLRKRDCAFRSRAGGARHHGRDVSLRPHEEQARRAEEGPAQDRPARAAAQRHRPRRAGGGSARRPSPRASALPATWATSPPTSARRPTSPAKRAISRSTTGSPAKSSSRRRWNPSAWARSWPWRAAAASPRSSSS